MQAVRLKPGIAGLVIAGALGASLGVAAAAPARADTVVDPRLTLSITSNPSDVVPVKAGDTVTFTYTVSNDNAVAVTPPAGSGVQLIFKWDYDGASPVRTNCGFTFWGFGDYGDYMIDWLGYELPAAVQPGESVSCTLAYTATAADVAYGGLWTMLTYEPDVNAQPEHWDYTYWYTVPAVGHSNAPAVVGTPEVGQPLTVDPGLWGPWDPPLSYQWLRDGGAIVGAVGASYTPTASDVGKAISATLSAATTGASQTTDPVVITAALRFADVAPGAPFYDDITWLADRGISKGSVQPDGSVFFDPAGAVRREAMAAFLYRFAGSPAFTPPATSPFVDVATSAMFYKEIAWLADSGISTGTAMGDGTFQFRPAESVSREAMAAFLYRFMGRPDFTAPAMSPFVDVLTSATFYKEISWLAANHISTGTDLGDGTFAFRPTESVSREAMAAFLHRTSNLTG